MIAGTKRAAYLQQASGLFGRPFDDGVIRALLDAGYRIDHYSPNGDLSQEIYGNKVCRHSIDYRARWLRDNLTVARRRGYELIAANTELPLAFGSIWAAITRCRLVCVCDEIYAGGYRGAAAPHWKRIARWGMRRADMTVITDPVRIPLQRNYAGISNDHRFVDYPSAYSQPLWDRFDRSLVRAELGIQEDEWVISHAGNFSHVTGGTWAILLEEMLDSQWKILVQTGGQPDRIVDSLLRRVAHGRRLIYLPERLDWLESMRWTSAADIGLVVYLSNKPQFQRMGVSSTKLCTFLSLGIPVIATRQPSFEFLERLGGGILVESLDEVPGAVAQIATNYPRYKVGARRCMYDHVRPSERLRELTEALRRL